MKCPRELLARCALVQRPMLRKDVEQDKMVTLPDSHALSASPSPGHALYSELMRRHDRVRARSNE